MTRRPMTLLALPALCLATLGMSSTAHAAKGMEVAVQDDNVFVKQLFSQGSDSSAYKGLARARELHATWVRANVSWAGALGSQAHRRKKPKQLRYDWTLYDVMVQRVQNEYGMKAELTLTGPPPRWAAGNHKSKFPIVRPNARRFGQFAHDAAEHFSARGVHRYLIWNEPNLAQWLSPQRKAPRMYRSLYTHAYSAIKRVDPAAQVFIGETSPYGIRHHRATPPLRFLRGVTCVNSHYRHRHCKGLKTDGYAHHPYDFKHKPTYRYPGKDNVTVATLSRLTKALSRLRHVHALSTPEGGVPYVYLTEYGYFAAYKYRLPRKKQGRYLVKGFKIAEHNSRVKQMLQYILVPPPHRNRFFSTQIMNRRFSPYPAFKALRRWANHEARHGRIATTP